MTTREICWTTATAVVVLIASSFEVRGQTTVANGSALGPQAVAGYAVYPGFSGYVPAQYPPGGYYAAPGGYYAVPAAYQQVAAPGMPPYPTIAPASYQESVMRPAPEYYPEEVPPQAYDPGEATTLQELEGCKASSGCCPHGAPGCGCHGNAFGGILHLLGPYHKAGCCAPHWFDIHAEVLSLRRQSDEPSRVYSMLGQPSGGGTPVLTSSDIDLDDSVSVRITGTYQTGPGSNLEFTYLGANNYDADQSAADATDNLFGVYDNFGEPPFALLQQIHEAEFQSISLESNFDSLELNYRRRWVGPTCALQGSWLVGVRYFELTETFEFFSLAARPDPPTEGGTFKQRLRTRNYMTGGQLGGDLWLCILPGLRLGLDGKFALLGNNAKVSTVSETIDPYTPFTSDVPTEHGGNDVVAFVGEVGIMLTYELNHWVTLRGGYQIMDVEGVALAEDNFNSTITGRVPFVNDGGALFYDGYTLGIEWLW